MITVIDSPCGFGKTQYMINMINENPTKNYVYITPFLNEVERIKDNTKFLHDKITRFVEPVYTKKKKKYDCLIDYIYDSKDIVSTHSLFSRCNKEIVDTIKQNKYTLILDEVMSVVKVLDISYRDIKLILDKLTRHPLMQDLTLETEIDYSIDFMRIVGVPNMFIDKCTSVKIVSYRGVLPDDYYIMNSVRDLNNFNIYRDTVDSFHTSENKSNYNHLTYKIQGNLIYTSTENNDIEISYKAIPTDEFGYPLIPDNSDFTRALELYIKKQVFTILFDLNKINANILTNAQQDYAWAVGDCKSEFNRLSLDKMESLSNSWRTLLIRTHQPSVSFKTNGDR